jgi:3-methyladenine DNA glycosylase AlkC
MEPFKNALGRPALARIAKNFRRAWRAFPERRFVERASRGLESLELKARVTHIARALDAVLPEDYAEALEIVLRAAAGWDRADPESPYGGFPAWPVIEWVGERGLSDFDRSLEALRRLTALASAEFAIREFIEAEPQRALRTLADWTRDPNEHVRRLVSEGTRPRLPWGRRLPAFVEEPAPIVRLLERLKDDPSEYVRRSVGNNLNDIAKDHPALVVEIAHSWLARPSEGRRFIVARALRTLVKAGDRNALAVLGFDHGADFAVESITLAPRRVAVGGQITFSFRLISRERKPQRVVVDYAVHHVRKNGERSAKVFKLRTLEIGPGEALVLEKRHSFRPITTRRYYPGRHAIDVLVNGRALASASFELRAKGR